MRSDWRSSTFPVTQSRPQRGRDSRGDVRLPRRDRSRPAAREAAVPDGRRHAIDLLESIRRGVDLFDCVMPTRNGRNALAFYRRRAVRLRNAVHERDSAPLEAGCPCPAWCAQSRLPASFIHAKEMLGPILLSIHNVTYYTNGSSPERGTPSSPERTTPTWRKKFAGWARPAAAS